MFESSGVWRREPFHRGIGDDEFPTVGRGTCVMPPLLEVELFIPRGLPAKKARGINGFAGHDSALPFEAPPKTGGVVKN